MTNQINEDYESLRHDLRDTIPQAIGRRLRSTWDYTCLKTSAVVGTGIHIYSFAINNKHFDGIYQDFAEGHLVKGTLKVAVPFVLPYAVSFYARKKAQKESKIKINELERRILELNK